MHAVYRWWEKQFYTIRSSGDYNIPWLVHYRDLLIKIQKRTLIIEINQVRATKLIDYLNEVLDQAIRVQQIPFEHIIFDASVDPFIEEKKKTDILNNFVKEKGIVGYLSLSQWNLKQHSHLIEIFYPSVLWMFTSQLQYRDLDLSPKSTLYSCLNRNPVWHRLLLYTLLKKNNLLEHFIYTFHDCNPYNGYVINPGYYNARMWQDFKEYYYQSIIDIADFPIVYLNDQQGLNDHSINHDAYNIAECNIVTESSTEYNFTSEKVWKPIAAGQLFHVVGSCGTLQWLESLGYLTWDDGYDKIKNTVQRIEAVVDLIGNQSQWSKENLEKIKHNHKLFSSGTVEKNLIDSVLAILNT